MVCVFFFSLCFVSPHGNVLTNHTQALVALQMFSQRGGNLLLVRLKIILSRDLRAARQKRRCVCVWRLLKLQIVTLFYLT